MDVAIGYFGILLALAIGVVSPGPSFVLIARTAVAQSRGNGLAAALGMGVGGVGFAGLALLGLHAVLAQVGWVYAGLKLAGAGYLLYLAVRLWQGAATPLTMPADARSAPIGLWASFWIGLATQVSNPKTAIVYGSVFAALLPGRPPGWIFVALPPAVFLLEAGWYAAVAVVFSSDRPRAAYAGAKLWLDRLAGAVMGLLGLRLIIETARAP